MTRTEASSGPTARPEAPARLSPDRDVIAMKPPADGIRVLVVDDDESLSALIRTRLERTEGFTVAGVARDLTDCLQTAERQQPDVVLVDLLLGGERGSDAIGPLCRLAPRAMIAVLTGLPAEIEEARLKRLGAFVYYEKSLLPELVDHLREDLALFDRALSGEEVVAPSSMSRRPHPRSHLS